MRSISQNKKHQNVENTLTAQLDKSQYEYDAVSQKTLTSRSKKYDPKFSRNNISGVYGSGDFSKPQRSSISRTEF
jgi:hypothetical protein